VRYRLTRAAEDDLIGIFRQGAVLFGPVQAERYFRELEKVFDLIAASPEIARERAEISPPVRVHPHKTHLVVYLIEDGGGVLIVRIRHSHEDWVSAPV